MNENALLTFGAIVALVAGFGALLILLAILRVALRATSCAIGQTIRAVWKLVSSMASDIRFLNMLAVIFCMIAERREGANWPLIALIVSLSAFVTANLHIAIFLLSSGILNWLRGQQVRFSDAAERFIHEVRLNIGFLGLIYLSLGFCSLCYSYHMASERTHLFPQQFDLSGGQGSYETFFSYTAQSMIDSIPAPPFQQMAGRFSTVRIPDSAALLWGVILFFRIAFWGALAALLSALFLPRRVFK